MMRILWAAALVIAAMACEQRPAQAAEGPWCAVINKGFDVEWDCYYNSVEACTPNILGGNRGFCSPNPRYHGVERRSGGARRHHRSY